MTGPRRIQEHSVLGAVVFDPLMLCWQTQSTVPLGDSDQIVLALVVSGDPDITAERFDEAVSILRRLDPRTLRRVVAEEFLELYNDTWRQDDDEAVDLDGFVARIRPTNVDVDEDGIEIYFNDGGLFAGHSIVLRLDTDLQVTDVKLAG